MNLKDAEKVINEYGDVLANNESDVYPLSSLPFSKEMIKEAFRSYYTGGSALGIFDDKIKNQLEIGYISLASFVNDSDAKLCLEDFLAIQRSKIIPQENLKEKVESFPDLSKELEIRESILKEMDSLKREFQDIVKYSK